MAEALDWMLDSGWLFLALGAVLCAILGFGAVRRMFRGASMAEPPHRHKDHH